MVMGLSWVMCTAMTEMTTLLRLLTWTSPSFPIGAFSYSHGLEWAVETGDVKDAHSLFDFVSDVTTHGAAQLDAVMLANAHRAASARDVALMKEVAELAAAYGATKELRQETLLQGRAFFDTAKEVWPCDAISWFDSVWSGDIAYPIAVGVASGGHHLALGSTVTAYLHGFAANLVSAGVRLVPLGQTDGQRVLARLEPLTETVAEKAIATPLEHMGASALMVVLASMKHETQYTRLFRS